MKKVRLSKLILFISLSILAHIGSLYALGIWGSFEYGPPVMLPEVVNIELNDLQPKQQLSSPSGKGADIGLPEESGSEDSRSKPLLSAQKPLVPPEVTPLQPPVTTQAKSPDKPPHQAADAGSSEATPSDRTAIFQLLQPFRMSGEFMTSESESLNYRISLLGIPVGSAKLVAHRERGEVRITLRLNSYPLLSSIYPVDDLIETRLINGNFITSRIRQKEGSFTADRGFTIFMRDKSVFWIDRLTRKSISEAIPSSDVVDILSGLYYLRNRKLKAGSLETVHIYDSNSYAHVVVEVLQRETIRMPDLSQVNSLVIRPNLKTEGIFRRTGEILIWLSDDDNRVPLRVETTVPVGRVTAELISSEVTR